MIRLVVALLALALPASATTDGWPALHDVTGVGADDVLNIRSAPNAQAEIVGTFPHNATDIEVIRPNEDVTWGYVAFGEGMGWVSLGYLVPQPGQWDGQFPAFTTCFGTEPFWNLRQDGDTLTFDGLSLPPVIETVERRSGSLNHRGRHSFVAGVMVGVLSNQLCNDGMSELEYGWELNLILRTGEPYREHYTGCCSIRPHGE